MHDFTLVLAIVAIALLAYQAEVDDRPPVRQEPWTHPREAVRSIFVVAAVLTLVVLGLLGYLALI